MNGAALLESQPSGTRPCSSVGLEVAEERETRS